MEYHYIVAAVDNTIIGAYGKELRELAFEKAAMHRKNGLACEVFTRAGTRQRCTAEFKKLGE